VSAVHVYASVCALSVYDPPGGGWSVKTSERSLCPVLPGQAGLQNPNWSSKVPPPEVRTGGNAVGCARFSWLGPVSPRVSLIVAPLAVMLPAGLFWSVVIF